jgi:Bromodomain
MKLRQRKRKERDQDSGPATAEVAVARKRVNGGIGEHSDQLVDIFVEGDNKNSRRRNVKSKSKRCVEPAHELWWRTSSLRPIDAFGATVDRNGKKVVAARCIQCELKVLLGVVQLKSLDASENSKRDDAVQDDQCAVLLKDGGHRRLQLQPAMLYDGSALLDSKTLADVQEQEQDDRDDDNAVVDASSSSLSSVVLFDAEPEQLDGRANNGTMRVRERCSGGEQSVAAALSAAVVIDTNSTLAAVQRDMPMGVIEQRYSVGTPPMPPVAPLLRPRRLAPAYARRWLESPELMTPQIDNGALVATPHALVRVRLLCLGVLNQLADGPVPQHTIRSLFGAPIDSPTHPFHHRLDAVEAQCRERLDLATIERRLHCKRYATLAAFHRDLQRVWDSARVWISGAESARAVDRLQRHADSLVAAAKQTRRDEWLHTYMRTCGACRQIGVLLPCDGGCLRCFHAHCAGVGASQLGSRYFVCNDCASGRLLYHWDAEAQRYFALSLRSERQLFRQRYSIDGSDQEKGDDRASVAAATHLSGTDASADAKAYARQVDQAHIERHKKTSSTSLQFDPIWNCWRSYTPAHAKQRALERQLPSAQD